MLRRLVDDPDAKVGADAAHLDGCAQCQARFKLASEDARSVATLLAVPEAPFDVDKAFARVTGAPKAQPTLGLRFPILRPAARPTLALVAALVAAAVFVVALAFGGFFFTPATVKPVRVIAPDILALSLIPDYGNIP